MPVTRPKSDFDRWDDREKDMDESHKTGKGVYAKGAKNAKGKKD